MLILNLKTYTESTGGNVYNLVNAVKETLEVNSEYSKFIHVAPSAMYLSELKGTYPQLNLAAQTVDNKPAGSTTGWMPAQNLADAGITLSIYNHSEHRQNQETIVEDIKAIQATGVNLVVCCENVEEAAKILEANPFAIAYEPKDLIGSGISVTTRPEACKEFISLVKGKTKVIIGAGVTTGEDVKNSLEMGADGVLLASAFVKATDPFAKLVELAMPFVK